MITDKAAIVGVPASVTEETLREAGQTGAQTSFDAADNNAAVIPPPDAVRKPRLHLDFLDGVRALAALSVILDHAVCVIWYKPDHNFPTGDAFGYGYLLLLGHFAVTTFIVLSGFCLMLPVATSGGVLKGGALHFYRKRAHRILPPYYLALVVCLLLIGTIMGQPTGSHWDSSIHVDAQGLITHALLLHNLFPGSFMQINNSLWTVAVEWQIYFAFPLLVLLWRRIGGVGATLLALACGYGIFGIIHHMPIWGLNPGYLGMFAVGALGAGIAFHPAPHYQKLREKLPAGPLALLMLGVAVAFCLRYGWPVTQRHLIFPDFFVGAAAALLLVSVSRTPDSPLRRALSWKPLVFLGTYAYSIYLMHVPLQQLFWQYALRPLNLAPLTGFFTLLLLGTPFILVGAYLFHLGCERPFMNHKPKIS